MPSPHELGTSPSDPRPPLAAQAVPDQSAPAVHVNFTKDPPRALARATVRDLHFVDALQHKFGHSLGFLPTAALDAHLQAGNVWLTNENGDEAGYILVRPRLGWQPELASIVQAAVCMDAQRRHHGLALLLKIEAEARTRGQVGLQANCAIGVEANDFWRAAGFKPIAHLTPNTKSRREIICWRKPLRRSLPAWFTDLPARAGHQAKPATSTRYAGRDQKETDFAARFVSGLQLPAGNPEHRDTPIILSTSPQAAAIMEGTTDGSIHAHQPTAET